MKRLALVLTLISMNLIGVEVSDNLLNAISKVESNNRIYAVGDKGKAFGKFQIWECVVKDANQFLKTNYCHADAFNVVKAKQITIAYLIRWGRHYEKKTGLKATDEVLARIWNGGPNGWKKQKTAEYWNKVQKEMKR